MAQRDRYGDHWGPSGNCVYDGDGVPSGPNYLLFSGVDRLLDSLRDRSKLGWSPTPHARVLGALQRALDRNLWQIMANRGIAQRTMGDVPHSRSGSVGGVGDCTCTLSTLGALGETSGLRIDRIPPTRPPWWRRHYRELKKLIFSAPSKCPTDLFRPLANGMILKQLLCGFFPSVFTGR